jgi:hypothetical protein
VHLYIVKIGDKANFFLLNVIKQNNKVLQPGFSYIIWKVLVCLMKMCSRGWAQWLIPVIPTTLEGEIKSIAFQGQSGQKVSETPSQPTSLSSQLVKEVNRRMWSKLAWEKVQDPI